MSCLPSSWIISTIGEVTTDCGQRVPEADEQFQYVDIGSIDRERKTVISPQQLVGRDAPSRARKLIRSGDVLVSMTRPNLNAVALVPKSLNGQIASTGFDVLRAQGIDPRWTFYLVRSASFVDRMSNLVQGALYPAVRAKDVRSFEAPVAPLNEQVRIADKLDAVLARVDSCQDHLDRIPAILKRFRQSVLSLATSGKLSEAWKGESGARSSWTLGKFSDLLIGKPRNGYSPRAVEKVTSVKSLSLSATTTGVFRPEYFKYIDEAISPDSHLWLEPDDILIQRANTLEYVGTSAMYQGPACTFIYPDLMMKARANGAVLPRFLLLILKSDQVREHFRSNATGTAGNMPKINQQTVLSAPACWPSLTEQAEIVRRVESLFTFADRIEARYAAARAQVKNLTAATLAKAFRGELVPQDPNDEPANALLERIRAKRCDHPAGNPTLATLCLNSKVLRKSHAG